MLPIQLQAPPPRDPSQAGVLLSTGRSGVIRLLVASVVVVPAFLILLAVNFGAVTGLGLGLAMGIGGVVELFAVGLFVQQGRAKALCRTGVATLGRVRRIDLAGGQGYLFMQVEFQDQSGQVRLGRATTLAKKADCKEGGEIAVLYDPSNPKRFAFYTPAIGMVPGVAKQRD